MENQKQIDLYIPEGETDSIINKVAEMFEINEI